MLFTQTWPLAPQPAYIAPELFNPYNSKVTYQADSKCVAIDAAHIGVQSGGAERRLSRCTAIYGASGLRYRYSYTTCRPVLIAVSPRKDRSLVLFAVVHTWSQGS